MRYFPLCLALVTAALSSGRLMAEEPKPSAKPRLGINLAGPADWNTELPFVDVFRFSRKWISQQQGKPWGQGPALELDEQGWVKRLEKDCYAETPLCTIPGGHYPAGVYTVFYEGEGRLEFWGGAEVALREPGRLLVKVDPARSGFFLRIMATNPENYVRNIRVVMPGFDKSYEKNPWHPLFLKRWQGMAAVRFMDFMETNNSKIAAWEERPTLLHATFAEKGVPLELLIDLANRLKADPWFCLPHRADDEYVRQFAKMTKDRLDPALKAYVEYSNEVWNGQFEQQRYAAEEGRKLGFAEKPHEAAWRYTAHRSVQIFRIWEEEFGGTDRVVRVLPAQAANSYVAQQILSFQEAARHADALAIAPYVSLNVSPNGSPNADTVASWSVDEVLDYLEQKSVPQSRKWIEDNQNVAEAHGLRLVAYEGGQHMVGVQGAENNDRLTKLLHEANAHPRMKTIYERHLNHWKQAGGDVFCHFFSVSQWSKWGSWGTMQFYDEKSSNSPKASALFHWARTQGQNVSWPD